MSTIRDHPAISPFAGLEAMLERTRLALTKLENELSTEPSALFTPSADSAIALFTARPLNDRTL